MIEKKIAAIDIVVKVHFGTTLDIVVDYEKSDVFPFTDPTDMACLLLEKKFAQRKSF